MIEDKKKEVLRKLEFAEPKAKPQKKQPLPVKPKDCKSKSF